VRKTFQVSKGSKQHASGNQEASPGHISEDAAHAYHELLESITEAPLATNVGAYIKTDEKELFNGRDPKVSTSV
jgi:hypothetical protein